MSIFDDKELINKLIEAGLDFNHKFAAPQNPSAADFSGPSTNLPPPPQRPLPTMPAVEPSAQQQMQQTLEFAKSLAVNLQRTLGDPDAPKTIAPISTGTNQQANFTIADGRTLGHFVQWLAKNKIMWGGKRIAWTEDDPDKPNDAWTFESLDANLSQRDADNQPIKHLCHANKDLLINYLVYLRDEAVKSVPDPDRKPFEIIVKNLIGELNRHLGRDKQLQVKTQPSRIAPEMDPNSVVDAFADDIIVVDSNGKDNRGLNYAPFFPGARVPLTLGNLADPGALGRWLNNMKIKRPTDAQPIPVMDVENGDPCVALRALYNRAAYLNGVAASYNDRKPGYDRMTARYLKAITDLAPSFRNGDGPCNVTSATVAPGTGQPGQPGTEQPTAPGGKLSSDEVAKLTELLTSLPLEVEAIDLAKINRFIDNAAAFDRSVASGPVATDSIRRFYMAMGNLQQMMQSRFPRIELSWSFPDIASTYLRDPNKDFQFFKDKLKEAVSTVAALISALYSAYGPQLPQNIKSNMFQQTNYVAKENFSRLESFQDVINRRFRIRS